MNTNKRRATFRLGRPGAMAQLRCGFSSNCGKTVAHDFLTKEFALVYIFSGAGRYECDGKVYAFSRGDIFQRFPDIAHTIYFDADTESAYVAIPAEARKLLELSGFAGLNTPVITSDTPQEEITEKFLQTIDILANIPANRLFEAMVKMQELIAFLLFHNKPDRLSDRACRIITANLCRKIAMAKIAAQFNMSYSLFRKKFTEEMGMPPGKYLIRKRIEHAYALLERKEGSVGEVADQLGYPDIYTFSHQFKKFTGINPSQLRNI